MAERLNGTIINADASQLYADLRILTARPTPADEARVPHRLYGVLDGDVIASAAAWAGLARVEIAAAHAAGRLPIIVGGTGLYLRTLIDGIAPIPPIDAAIRESVRSLSTAAAAAALAGEDPAATARLMPGDRQRILRALEVVRSTGSTLAAWQQRLEGGIARDFTLLKQIVNLPRDELHRRARQRLGLMVATGAIAEATALAARRLPADRPVMRALGVAEFAAITSGQTDLATAIELVAIATRQYQKRQSTWLRNQFADWPSVAASNPESASAD